MFDKKLQPGVEAIEIFDSVMNEADMISSLANYSNLSLVEIGISTIEDRIEKIRELLPLMDHEGAIFTIVHQVQTQREKPEWLPSTTRYFQTTSVGVGKSRNTLISHAVGDYLWFMDDDIVLPRKSLDAICALVRVIRFSGLIIGCDRRSDPSSFISTDISFDLRELDDWEVTNIGTPRIILSMPASDYERFPEDIGAGTKKPFGDEAIFLGACVKKRRFLFSSADLISHAYESSGVRRGGRWKLRVEVYLRTFGLRRVAWIVLKKLWLKLNQ